MATYYKYQERDPGSEINWAEVGSNFSGMLQEEARTRTAKKQAIDDSTREQQRVLDNAVQGDSTNMNQWTLDYAANATEQMMMTNRLMKSGDLSMKDFTMMRQNLADGTDQAFTLSQEYQAEYADKMARADCKDPSGVGCSQQLELDMMASAEGFGNFNKSQLVIDPQTGKVNVGFYKDNGKGVMELDSNPNSLVGINNLRNRIKGKVELYDMDGAVSKAAKGFGKYDAIRREIGSLNKKGQITITSDVTQRGKEIKAAVKSGKLTMVEADRLIAITPGWDQVEDAWLESQLSNTFNVSSLLTNNLGQIDGISYKFTHNKDEVDATTILLKNVDGTSVPDWETKIGKQQRQKAKDGLRTVLRGALDHTVKVSNPSDSAGYEPVANQNANTQNEIQENATEIWNEMYTATAERRNVLSDALISSPQGKKEGLTKLNFIQVNDPNGGTNADGTPLLVDAVEFYYNNSDKNRTGDNAQLLGSTADEHSLAGIEITGQTDKEKRMVGLNADDKLKGTRSGVTSGRDQKANTVQDANVFIRSTISGQGKDAFAISQSEEDFTREFSAKFSSLGFTVTTPTNPYEKVLITASNNETIEIFTNYAYGDGGEQQQTNLRDWMASHITEAGADAWSKTGVGNETKGELD